MSTTPTLSSRSAAPIIGLVDDDTDSRAMYRQYLEWEGFGVAEASDGLQALEQAATLPLAAIVMDLTLPRLDGWEAVRRLKADPATKCIPVLALTAHAFAADAEQARAVGCDGYLSKPCLPEDLVRAIKALIKRRPAAPPRPARSARTAGPRIVKPGETRVPADQLDGDPASDAS